MNSERFRFVSDFVEHTANQFDPPPGRLLKQLLQSYLQQIINQEYRSVIPSLCHWIRETQSSVAYLLLAEAYAQTGRTELALATLDVLSCVEPDRSEAERMKHFLLQENCDCAEITLCRKTHPPRIGLNGSPRELTFR